jgi:hypothetical protein
VHASQHSDAAQDPFCEGSLDTVRVRKDFAEIQRQLQLRAQRLIGASMMRRLQQMG